VVLDREQRGEQHGRRLKVKKKERSTLQPKLNTKEDKREEEEEEEDVGHGRPYVVDDDFVGVERLRRRAVLSAAAAAGVGRLLVGVDGAKDDIGVGRGVGPAQERPQVQLQLLVPYRV
jgi:hypothetical protein